MEAYCKFSFNSLKMVKCFSLGLVKKRKKEYIVKLSKKWQIEKVEKIENEFIQRNKNSKELRVDIGCNLN